ncbi:uncharacterized protein AC631_04539 [Debaryomyces fabryi]|uniref:Putative lipoate-protein ligase A n=1 Tax=Debaryomyces fabryi TaxID=58627 RepID=A0A0V1PTV2_9ASCO|nr:uncharacterized protein AC631_04539 [Debaryomyces fabryi]KRZ99692.1 hypothetical protein AC631_04539 [Debaryomyces fabryi]CUM50942.1 unnamed protein product [Debaryomyces fabryi]
MIRRSLSHIHTLGTRLQGRRCFGNIHVPFQDDLDPADADDFNLLDFQHYKESKDILEYKQKLYMELEQETPEENAELQKYTELREPVIFVSKLKDPYLNLAIEDSIYNDMPIPDDDSKANYNRLMFYKNWPCAVIGKNQNPWKEVNLPLLNSLHIPLVRRRSGGGTVVHDLGNINYSFMTTKSKFDRFKFAEIIRDSVNKYPDLKYKLKVNERGDITTVTQSDGIAYKVSGSAYKLSKGKSYHHGTMLLNLKLDVLSKLLTRDERKLGIVDSMASINSVKSKVINLELDHQKFIDLVSDGFSKNYGMVEKEDSSQKEKDPSCPEEYDHNELFNLTDFVEAYSDYARVITIDEKTELNQKIYDLANELKEWKWKYGSTPKFSHELYNEKFGFTIKFHIKKGAIIDKFELSFDDITNRMISTEKIEESFEFLQQIVETQELQYTGSNVSGFITNDMISDWVGQSIDGTM